MTNINVTFRGVREVTAMFEAARQAGNGREVQQAFFAVGTQTLNLAKDFTPVDTGTLKRSGRFKMERAQTRLGLKGRITFGGAAAPYAVFVHENLTARHTLGGAKYLERAMLITAKDFDRLIREAFARALRRAQS